MVRCKRWSCDVCREINRRRVIALAKTGHPTAMLTLTVSSAAYATPDDAARDLKRALVALRKRIARAWPGEKMPFLAVFERHESGFPHLHLLIRARFLPVNRLREMWRGITQHSWNVNIKAIKTPGMLAYAAKYIGKDLAAFANCKRWWRSHDFTVDKPNADELRRQRQGWNRWMVDIRLFQSAARALGCIVEQPERERITWRAPDGAEISQGDIVALVKAWWPSHYVSRTTPGSHK